MYDQQQATESANLEIWRSSNHVIELTDFALMQRVARGDVSAFSILVQRHSAALYRVAYRLLGDRHEAEDIAQESFARLWQHAAQWKSRGGGVVAWLHRVTINLCRDFRRRFRLILTETLPETQDDAPTPEQNLQYQDVRYHVEQALGQLPERHQIALILTYYEGLSNSMAAQVLDLNIKAMESLLCRARKRMRKSLDMSGMLCEHLEIFQ